MASDAIVEVDAHDDSIADHALPMLLSTRREPVRFVLPAHRRAVCRETWLDARVPDGRARPRSLRGEETYPLDTRAVAVPGMRRREPRVPRRRRPTIDCGRRPPVSRASVTMSGRRRPVAEVSRGRAGAAWNRTDLRGRAAPCLAPISQPATP